MMMKETVNRSFESPLSEGIWYERRMLHATFALADQKEGDVAGCVLAHSAPPTLAT